MAAPQTIKRLIPTRQVGARYGGKNPRTIKRWVDQGVLPPPDVTINKRHYWYEDGLDRHERALVAARAVTTAK